MTESSAAKSSAKRKSKDELRSLRSEINMAATTSKKRSADDSDHDDLDVSGDIKGIISQLQQIKSKAVKDGQKKNQETIGSVKSEIQTMIDDAKAKIEKERQSFLKIISKSSKECEISLRNEFTKFHTAYENFSKEKAAHVQIFKEIFSKYEDEKEKAFARYEQLRKKEKATLAELEKSCTDKITNAEEALKKKKLDDKSFSILRKSLDLFLEGGSDDDFGPDE